MGSFSSKSISSVLTCSCVSSELVSSLDLITAPLKDPESGVETTGGGWEVAEGGA